MVAQLSLDIIEIELIFQCLMEMKITFYDGTGRPSSRDR